MAPKALFFQVALFNAAGGHFSLQKYNKNFLSNDEQLYICIYVHGAKYSSTNILILSKVQNTHIHEILLKH